MALRLDTPLQYLKGVGPKLGDVFSRKGVKKISDILEFYPRAYEDRRVARNIASLRSDDLVSLKAQIVSVHSLNLGRSHRKIYDVVVKDHSGKIHCKFFRVPYRGYFERFTPLKEVRVVGKVIDYRGRLEFHHPEIRDVEPEEQIEDQLIPLYTEIEGLQSSKIQKLIRTAIEDLEDEEAPEILPKKILEQYELLPRKQALRRIHQPEAHKAREYIEQKSPAHRRIIFEEFFWLELYLASKKSGLQKEKAAVIQNQADKIKALLMSLPFPLTSAQKRAFEDIKKDLSSGSPMHRLIQGDVGCGKTLVAFMSAAYASESHYQSCLMAPTEILAEQHFKNAQNYLAPLSLNIALLTGKTKTAERKQILSDLQSGKVHLIIGTHALIEDAVQFQNLGLVIIDEQHRFGVEQRGILKNKGVSPHFLVMTATPIPRTLAMTVYGDLEVTTIDEMPPGRSPIQTRVINENKRPQALQFMVEQVKKGRQAYIVYPLVEESEKIDLKDAVTQYESLKQQFPDIRFDLLHGKMKPDEKERIMNDFRSGQTQVLVSTTVIEVGVDVPNANLMIIEHSERFGLSQLHQLRGRVGRGAHKSFCVLIMGYAVSAESRERIQFMESTSDGFKVAEFDLELRGPGEFMGTRQSGLDGFKMAHIVRDAAILQKAREAAFAILQRDPKLQFAEHQALKTELLRSHGPAALAGIG